MRTDGKIRSTRLVQPPGSVALQLLTRARAIFPPITFLAVAAVLLSMTDSLSATTSSVPLPTGFSATTDTTPLEIAGTSPLAVLGYVDFGIAHLYVPAESLLMVLAGILLVSRGRIGTVAGIALGGCAAGTLVLVMGCPCGSGSAMALWALLY